MNLRTDLQMLLDLYKAAPRNTPDFWLRQYLVACLPQWDATVGGSFNAVPSAQQTPMPPVVVKPGLPTDDPEYKPAGETPSDVAFDRSNETNWNTISLTPVEGKP